MVIDLGGEAVTVLTPSSRTVITLAPPEPWPSSQTEPTAESVPGSGWVLYLPAGDPISRGARVQVRGVVHIVYGQPADWGEYVVAFVARVNAGAQVNLRHASTSSWDPTSRQSTVSRGAVYATAVPASIQARQVRSGSHAPDTAEESLPTSPYIVGVDLAQAPQEGDLVEIVTADDPTLAGRVLRVDHVVRGGEPLNRQLYCSLIALPSTD